MKRFGPLLLLFILSLTAPTNSQSQEPYESNQTYTYEDAIRQYEMFEATNPKYCKLMQMGASDAGEPVSLFIINKDGKFESEDFKNKTVLLINNGIHPGEPCGIDATIKLCKDLLANPKKLPQNVVIGIIPLYNVGGALNRNCCSRTNQDGPEMYGFRGNAKNLDLNRDFIKADANNTKAFYKIYHYLNPHIFVDTHTSNGADYKHIMTLITSQVSKMHPELAKYTLTKLNPALYEGMKNQGYDMVPYVHTMKQTPDDGIKDYMETPRYSTGYTNLFNTIGFVTETHMLKTFQQRVESTYAFLEETIEYMEINAFDLMDLKRKADYSVARFEKYELEWTLDTTKCELIQFKGYEAEWKPSDVSGQNRLYYNHEKPYEKQIKYFNCYQATKSVERPEYYIVPKQWHDIIDLMKMNEVEVLEFSEDVELNVEVYFIADYETLDRPYEGHYLHHGVEVVKDTMTLKYRKGDYAIPTRNHNARFVIETLEPHAVDSYLAWNYFDAVLQQKEWFSSYVFEDEAAQILKDNPEIKKKLEEKKASDEEFAKSAFAQLYFIFKNSPHYEPTHKRYPVTRMMGEIMNDQVVPISE